MRSSLLAKSARRIWLLFCVQSSLCPVCRRRLLAFEPKGFVDQGGERAIRYACPSCGYVFSDELRTRFQSRHGYPEPLFCDGCGFAGWESQGLELAAGTRHYVIVCRNCRKRDAIAGRAETELTHDPRVGYLCPQCGIGPMQFLADEYTYSLLGSRSWAYYEDRYECNNCNFVQVVAERKVQF
jgi:ssDNA-binding Zn-finger/Zn-ribbon topoisomerase 1